MDKIILIELIEKGYSTYQIGKELNKGQSTVRFWLNKFGLKTRHKKIGDKDFDYSISGSNHEEGKTKINQKNLEFWKKFQDYMYDNHTWNECSKEFNVSIVTIAKAKKLGLIKTRSLTESVRYFVNHKETKEQRINRSLKAKDGIKNAKLNNVAFGGYRHGAGRGKKFKVIDAFNQPVCLQSSFEFKLFNILSELKINWIRPNYLPYTINNTNKKYFPDFYLTDYKIYIDTKNDYLIKLDAAKIDSVEKQNNLKIHILFEELINKEHILKLINGPVA